MYTSTIQIFISLGLLPIAYFLNLRWRLFATTLVGVLILLVFSPASFYVLLVTTAEAILLEKMLRNLPKKSLLRQYLPYVLLLNVFYVDVAKGFLSSHFLSTMAIGFSVIRIFMTTKQLLGLKTSSRNQRLTSLFSAAYFFPALVVGPVFSGTSLWNQADNKAENPPSFEAQYRKIFAGWILSSMVAETIWLRAGDGEIGVPTKLPEIALLFVYLFSTFWGRSLIAEGTSALLGFNVPKNFDRPWLATDFKDFWARWHISMSKFVTQYIFLPLNLRGVSPTLATVIAFVYMGTWHQLRPGYLIWGFCHGVLVAKAPIANSFTSRTSRLVFRLITLSTIVLLSYVANYAFA